MAQLVFNSSDARELQRQCRHHNIFPVDVGDGIAGDAASVSAILDPMIDACVRQLHEMTPAEVEAVVQAIPAGLRMMVEPIENPLSNEYLRRVAGYCIASEMDKAYSPVKDVLDPHPANSEVLEFCPELEARFDEDGLLTLSSDFRLLDGGIKYGEHLLHYHQFLRRGFASNPNFDFLGTLAHYRQKTGELNSFRIAIDHRRIMKYADYRMVMELDTWYGPRFDTEKLDDPQQIGLTVIGRTQPSPFDISYPLLRTEFLWKANEREAVKTLEVEEIASPNSPYDHWHINRYIHAERDMTKRTFCHFDGAAKVYAQNAYLPRVEKTMPNNSRPSSYVKLFRIDGAIELDAWLSLVSMFFKGNEMVVEYFDPDLFDKKFRPVIDRWRAAKNS
jgi:hypothetical protein